MEKKLGRGIFIALFLLITFFGLGPVVMGDGSKSERITTLVVTLLIYGVWLRLYRNVMRRLNDK